MGVGQLHGAFTKFAQQRYLKLIVAQKIIYVCVSVSMQCIVHRLGTWVSPNVYSLKCTKIKTRMPCSFKCMYMYTCTGVKKLTMSRAVGRNM